MQTDWQGLDQRTPKLKNFHGGDFAAPLLFQTVVILWATEHRAKLMLDPNGVTEFSFDRIDASLAARNRLDSRYPRPPPESGHGIPKTASPKKDPRLRRRSPQKSLTSPMLGFLTRLRRFTSTLTPGPTPCGGERTSEGVRLRRGGRKKEAPGPQIPRKIWGISAWMLGLFMVLSAVLENYSDLAVVGALLVNQFGPRVKEWSLLLAERVS